MVAPEKRFFYTFIIVLIQIATLQITADCPSGFKGPVESKKDPTEKYCYRRKDPETFSKKFDGCEGNSFTLTLYQDLGLPKPDRAMWGDHKSAYPGGPFMDWSYDSETMSARMENSWDIPLSPDFDLSQYMCVVIDPEKNFTMANCDENHYRYCIVPYDTTSDINDVNLTLTLDSDKIKLKVTTSDGSDFSTSDILCLTDSSQYFPIKVTVTEDSTNTFTVSHSETGYYWCTHTYTSDYKATESNKILYFQTRKNFVNEYSVKIKIDGFKYTGDLAKIKASLEAVGVKNLNEYVYLNTQYRKSRTGPYDVEKIQKFKADQPKFKYEDADVIQKDVTLRRLYLDGQTILFHMFLMPDMKPVEPGRWESIEVVSMRPVYYCADNIDLGMSYTKPGCKLFTCEGDFNEGVITTESRQDGCDTTPKGRVKEVVNSMDHLLNSSASLAKNDVEDVFNERGDFVAQVIAQLKEFLNSSDPIRVEDLQNVFTQVDNVLFLEGIDIPNRFLHLLDDIGSRVDLGSPNFTSIVKNNLALLAGYTQPNTSVNFRVSTRNSQLFTNGSVSMINEIDSNQLSTNESEVIVSLPKFSSKQRVSFIVFKDNRAFQETHEHHKVNSRVLSIKVENLTKFPPGQTIDIHLKPFKDKKSHENFTCAYWKFNDDKTGSWSQDGCNYFPASEKGQLDTCKCDHLTHFALIFVHTGFPVEVEAALEELSLAGCYMSILGILLIGLTAAVLRSWRRDFQNKIWGQLSISILFLTIAFLVVVFAQFKDNSISCIMTGVVLHYSVLSSFCWMLVAAVVSYRRLVAVFSQDPSHKLLRAAAFAWGTPLIILSILFAVAPHSYSRQFDSTSPTGTFCYPSGLALWLTVHAPISLLILLNFTILLLILRSVLASSKFNKQKDGEALRWATVCCFLVFLFGLPWIFGLVSFNVVCAFLFTIFGTFQGAVLFLLFVCNRKSRDLWLIKLKFKGKTTPGTLSTDVNRSRGVNLPLDVQRPLIK